MQSLHGQEQIDPRFLTDSKLGSEFQQQHPVFPHRFRMAPQQFVIAGQFAAAADFPPEIEIIKEVTEDRRYTNSSMALSIPFDPID